MYISSSADILFINHKWIHWRKNCQRNKWGEERWSFSLQLPKSLTTATEVWWTSQPTESFTKWTSAEYLLEQRRSFYFQITILGSQIWSRPFVTFWQTAEELITSKFKWTPSGCQFDWKSFLSPELRSASHQRLRVHWAIDWPDRLCVSPIWWTTDDICEAGGFVKVCGAAHFRDLSLNTGFVLETRLNHAAPSNVEEEQLCSESLLNLRGRIQTPRWWRLCPQCFLALPAARGHRWGEECRSINKSKALLSRTTEKAPKVVDVRQEVWLTKLKCWAHGRAVTWYLVLT